MYGLLTNVVKLPPEAVYITIRINNFKSSVDYNGERIIYLLDPEIFTKIYNSVEMYLRKVD